MEGTLNLTVPELLPVPGQPLVLPLIVSGQFFAVDCNPFGNPAAYTDCSKVAPSFGVDFTGIGIMTAANVFDMDPEIGVSDVQFNWIGTAETIVTPEPPSGLMFLGVAVVLFIAHKVK